MQVIVIVLYIGLLSPNMVTSSVNTEGYRPLYRATFTKIFLEQVNGSKVIALYIGLLSLGKYEDPEEIEKN